MAGAGNAGKSCILEGLWGGIPVTTGLWRAGEVVIGGGDGPDGILLTPDGILLTFDYRRPSAEEVVAVLAAGRLQDLLTQAGRTSIDLP